MPTTAVPLISSRERGESARGSTAGMGAMWLTPLLTFGERERRRKGSQLLVRVGEETVQRGGRWS